jgi:hypothetical protein
MVDAVGSKYGNTYLHETGQTQGAQQTGRTQGTKGVGTGPGEVTQQQRQLSIPQNDPPRITPQEMVERCDNIIRQLNSSKVGDMSQIMLQIEEMQHELEQGQQKAQTTGIEANQKVLDANAKEQTTKLAEAQEKMEAQKTWDTFKDVFTYAALAVGVVAAVATGGVLAIGIAALGAAVTVLQQTKGMDKIFDFFGASQGVRTGVTIGLSVLMIAASATNVALLAKGVGTSLTAPLLPKVLDAIKLASAAGKVGAIAQGIKIGSQVAGGSLKFAEAGMQVGSTVARLESDKATKEQKDMAITHAKLTQQLHDMIEEIKASMERDSNDVEVTANVIKGNAQTMTKIVTASGV